MFKPQNTQMKTHHLISVKPTELNKAIEAALISVGIKKSRYDLHYVYMKLDKSGRFKIFSCDSSRISRYNFKTAIAPSEISEDDEIKNAVNTQGLSILPEDLKLVQKLIDGKLEKLVTIHFNRREILFTCDDRILTVPIGAFTNHRSYDDLIPRTFSGNLVVDRIQLLTTLKSFKKAQKVKISTAIDIDFTEYCMQLTSLLHLPETLTAGMDGDSFRARFNLNYLLEGVNLFEGGTVSFCVSKDHSSVVIKDDLTINTGLEYLLAASSQYGTFAK